MSLILLTCVVTWIGAGGALQAQQPVVVNGQVRQVSAVAPGLEATIRSAIAGQSGPLWVGYAVPLQPGNGQSGCWVKDEVRGGERTASVAPVKLEGATHVAILLRYEGGAWSKTRAVPLECPLDAGGLPLYWISRAEPRESIALLSARPDPPVHVFALHAGDAARHALENLAAPAHKDSVRRDAMFWLARTRGRAGFEFVRRVATEDSADNIREHALFALSQSGDTEASPALVRIARQDRSPHVRGRALFWLAQKASREAAAAINAAIENDPDTEVKKQAVFALSQLPKDESVPKLIQVAQSSANPAVRKQAMFWLGQSRDPRALDFFERVLAGPGRR